MGFANDDAQPYGVEPHQKKQGIGKKAVVIIGVILALLLVVLFAVFGFGSWVKSNENPFESAFSEDMYYSVPQEEHIVTDAETGIVFVDNEVIVYSEESASENEVVEAINELGGQVVGRIAATNSYQVRLNEGMTYNELSTLIDALEAKEFVSCAFANHMMSMNAQEITNDIAWNEPYLVWGYDAINLPEAWDLVKADSSVVVGLLENQVYEEHEDLEFSSTIANAFDPEAAFASHGTHVAGTVAAKANEEGSVGVAYGASLACFSYGDGAQVLGGIDYCNEYLYEFAITYMIVQQGARVINIGAGDDLLAYAASENYGGAITELQRKAEHLSKYLNGLLNEGYDFVICKSSGNQNSENVDKYTYIKVKDEDKQKEGVRFGLVRYEKDSDDAIYSSYTDEEIEGLKRVASNVSASFDEMACIEDEPATSHIIVVGAAGLLDINEREYEVANFSCGGSRVDVIAPGKDIYSSTVFYDKKQRELVSTYDYDSGTSMAAPMVSGVAALVYSADPNLKGDEVKKIIRSTASGEYQDKYSDPDSAVYGMLNAEAAVKKALNPDFEKDVIKSFMIAWLDQWKFENGEFKKLFVQRDIDKLLSFIDPSSSLYGSFEEDISSHGRLATNFAMNVQDIVIEGGEKGQYEVVVSFYGVQNDVTQDVYDRLASRGVDSVRYGVSTNGAGYISAIEKIDNASVGSAVLKDGLYQYANGDFIAELNVETENGKTTCYWGEWFNYGQSASVEDFSFAWVAEQREYEVVGQRSGQIMKVSIEPLEKSVVIEIENTEGALYADQENPSNIFKAEYRFVNVADHGSSEGGEGVSSSTGGLADNWNSTWLSTDGKYVFYMGNLGGAGNFSDACYVNLVSGNEKINCDVQNVGQNTISVKPFINKEKSFTFVFNEGQFVSDELILNKIPSEYGTQVLGSWSGSSYIYEFGSDGKYKVHGKNKWGYYFVISSTEIVLSDSSSDYEVVPYSCNGNVLTLDGVALHR